MFFNVRGFRSIFGLGVFGYFVIIEIEFNIQLFKDVG